MFHRRVSVGPWSGDGGGGGEYQMHHGIGHMVGYPRDRLGHLHDIRPGTPF